MLLQRSLAILQQDHQLLTESLHKKYGIDGVHLPIPGHLAEQLLMGADEETSDLIGQACHYQVPVLRLQGNLLEQHNRSLLLRWKYESLLFTDAKLEVSPAT